MPSHASVEFKSKLIGLIYLNNCFCMLRSLLWQYSISRRFLLETRNAANTTSVSAVWALFLLFSSSFFFFNASTVLHNNEIVTNRQHTHSHSIPFKVVDAPSALKNRSERYVRFDSGAPCRTKMKVEFGYSLVWSLDFVSGAQFSVAASQLGRSRIRISIKISNFVSSPPHFTRFQIFPQT